VPRGLTPPAVQSRSGRSTTDLRPLAGDGGMSRVKCFLATLRRFMSGLARLSDETGSTRNLVPGKTALTALFFDLLIHRSVLLTRCWMRRLTGNTPSPSWQRRLASVGNPSTAISISCLRSGIVAILDISSIPRARLPSS
jgi:hypothetical protein